MEDRGNKTIMCSVLFLDIVEYSKKSVTGQISLKDRFNAYISAAISEVPVADRIILDTGDGAAINFLGDVEDALKAALSVRESLLNEDPSVEPPLLVRMGVNLGPVRLVRDINGQPNIVGDGINVAQRVMGFADASQVLVSRSYYDAVSRLSPQYAGMFHYQGSRTDKHVREHEVYAIGYPGDQTAKINEGTADNQVTPGFVSGFQDSLSAAWSTAAARLGEGATLLSDRFQQADSKQRAVYLAMAGIPLALLLVIVIALKSGSDAHVSEDGTYPLASGVQPVSSVPSPVVGFVSGTVPSTAGVMSETDKDANASKTPANPVAGKKAAATTADSKKHATQNPARTVAKNQKSASENTVADTDKMPAGYLTVTCREIATVFVDGAQKGKTTAGVFRVSLSPGTHTVIVTHPAGGVYNRSVDVVSGKAVGIKPGFCD